MSFLSCLLVFRPKTFGLRPNHSIVHAAFRGISSFYSQSRLRALKNPIVSQCFYWLFCVAGRHIPFNCGSMLALLNQCFVRCDGKYFAMRNSLSAWNKSYSDGCSVYSLRNFCAAGGAKVPTISMRATQHKDLPVARAPEGVSQKCHAVALSLGRRQGGFGCCPVPVRVSKAATRRESPVS